jgi:hypothetical protein
MKTTSIRAVLRIVLGLALGASCTTCASAPKKEDPIMTVEEFERNSPPPADTCRTRDGEPLQCENEEDCCQGFVCTRDPGRSHINRYCIEG